MLSVYLTDIEQLLSVGYLTAAMRAALSLPMIASALTDDVLHTSQEEFIGWCCAWISPNELERYGAWSEEAGCEVSGLRYVPAGALKQMRLCRHARPLPLGIRPRTNASIGITEDAKYAACLALIAATRRWYGEFALNDDIVQTNLARLAVLR
jgi:hypothetical protein